MKEEFNFIEEKEWAYKMIFNKITLENFGLFRGKHVFELSPTSINKKEKPIILFGGKNGTGKTTLFEAVKLCLYGNSMFGSRIKKSDYEDYLLSKIHKGNGHAPTFSASIEVEFEYHHLGKREIYAIKRIWNKNDDNTSEELTMKKDDLPLKELEDDQWQDFLKELIPIGLSRLFFFDGEKIQNLAEDEGHNEELKNSVKSLLGLDLVEKLIADLEIYKSKQVKNNGNDETKEIINKLQQEKETLLERLELVKQERAHNQTKLDRVLEEIGRQEHIISKEGGSFANKREELKAAKNQCEIQIAETENKIRDISADLLPFTLVPKLCRKLQEQLIREEDYNNWKITQKALKLRLKQGIDSLESSQVWRKFEIKSGIKKAILDEFVKDLESSQEKDIKYQNFKPIHNISEAEQRKIINTIEVVVSTMPNEINLYTKKLEKLTRQLREIENKLLCAPDDNIISPLIQKANALHQQLGNLQFAIRKYEDEINHTQNSLNEVERKLQKYVNVIIESQNLSYRLKLISQIQSIMQEYLVALKEKKLKELSELFLEYFNNLSRKNNLIQKIEINQDDFSVLLYKANEQVIPRAELSAGEKQIYSIAMLWALTHTSGRSLPFIIDTPLGRLDSDHRHKIVKNFFPKASKQVIILSTDTEIDEQHFESLKNNISHAYHLEFNRKEMATEVTRGYFWEK